MHNECASVLLVADGHEGLLASEGCEDAVLECFVLFVDFAVFLLPVVFYNIVYVYVGGLEEGFGTLWVGVVAHFHLLALQLDLLHFGVFRLLFFGLDNGVG